MAANRKLKKFGSVKSLKFCELVNLMVIVDKKKVECVADVVNYLIHKLIILLCSSSSHARVG